MTRKPNDDKRRSKMWQDEEIGEPPSSDKPVQRFASPAVKDANRDPITGTPGAHPIGVGTGAAGGGATGAVVGGLVGGPIGAGVGAVVGAVAGGLAGKGVAEAVNPTEEHAFWRDEYTKRPYVTKGSKYELYAPAYQYGWESYTGHIEDGMPFDELEPELRKEWEARSENDELKWKEARAAARDAWERLEQSNRDREGE